MAYQKQTWTNFPSTATPISAERLSHMETQYDESVEYTDEQLSSKASLDSSGRVVLDQIPTAKTPIPDTIPVRSTGGRIEGVGSPTDMSDAATKGYVDFQIAESGGGGSDLRVVRSTLGDYTDRLDPLINVPARPIPNLWPQGICFEEEEQVFYVYYAGSISGADSVRIVKYSVEGQELDYRDVKSASKNTTLPLTASESIPYWFVGSDLLFLLTTGSSGRGRVIYNWSQDAVVGSEFEVLGGYRGEFDGDDYVTPNSVDSTRGVSQLFYYDASSVKAGTPTLKRTLYLQMRSARRKLQGFSSHEGFAVGLTGPAGEMPGIISWSSNGNQNYSFEYDRRSMGELVNYTWPETIVNVDSYHTEPEGSWSDSSGRYYFGNVINNGNTARFVIFRTGNPTATKTKTHPDPDSVDSGWVQVPITGTDYFEPWSTIRSGLEVRRVGPAVYLRGELRSLQANWNNQVLGSISFLGPAFVPTMAINSVQQGSSSSRFALTVNSAGTLTMGRADAGALVNNAFISLGLTYLTD